MADETNKQARHLESAEQAERERLAREAALYEEALAEQEAAEAAAAEEQQKRERQSGQNLDIERLKRQYEQLKKIGPERRKPPQPKTPSKPTPTPTGKSAVSPAARGLGQGAGKAAQSVGRAGSRAAAQTARAAARIAARIAAQVARILAQLAARVAAFLVSNPIGVTIIIVVIVITLIILAILFFAVFTQGTHGELGRAETKSPAFVVEESKVKSLKALAGDLKAGKELTEETADKIIAALDEIKDRIEKGQDKKKAEILAQIEKTRTAVDKLRAAVIKAREETGTTEKTKTNQAKIPKYVLEARDEALKEINALLDLLKGMTGSLNERVVQIAQAEYERGVKETNGDNVPRYPDGTIAPYSIGDAWCGAFVNWVYHKAGYTDYKPPNPSYVPSISEYMRKNHYWFLAGQDTPQPGDLAFYSKFNPDGLDHIAIVVKVIDANTVVTIDGNDGNQISRRTRHVSSTELNSIHHFARMGY